MARYWIACVAVAVAAACLTAPCAEAQVKKGSPAPSFVAVDIKGQEVNLDKIIESKPDLVILFFFTTSTGEEIAVKLRRLDALYGKQKLKIAAIGYKEDEAALKKFADSLGIAYYIIKDTGELGSAQKYGPFSVLPQTFLVTDKKMILKAIEGSGKSEADVINEVAQAYLQQNKTAQAQAVADEAVKAGENPKAAKETKGYALVAEGKLDAAQTEFGAIDSKDGQAKVALQKGDAAKAVEIANQAPDNGYAQAIKAEALAKQGKIDEAAAAIGAAEGKPGADWKQSQTANTAGRIDQAKGNKDGAIKKYEQAVALDPYNVVALSNEGAAYREKGDLPKAAEVLQKAQDVRPDGLTAVMLQQIQKELKEANDVKRGELIRSQINDLRKRYEELKAAGKDKPADTWTTPPLVVGFLPGTQEAYLDRAGADIAIRREIEAQLQAGGTVSVVEREVLDKLLQELNLGSSQLADANTQLQLGKVLSARMLGFVEFANVGAEPYLYLRLVDTETTSIAAQLRKPIKDLSDINGLVGEVVKDIVKKVSDGRPLQGLVADAPSDDAVMVNLGKRHGVKAGQQFAAVAEGAPIEAGGKVLGHRETKVATLEVTQVEDQYSVCKVVNKAEGGKLAKEMHIKQVK